MKYIVTFVNAGETLERRTATHGDSPEQLYDVMKSVNPDCDITSIKEVWNEEDWEAEIAAEARYLEKEVLGH